MGDAQKKQYILPEDSSGHQLARVDGVSIQRGVTEPTELTEEQAERLNEALKLTNGGKELEEVKSKTDAIAKQVGSLSSENLDNALKARGLPVEGKQEEKQKALIAKIKDEQSG